MTFEAGLLIILIRLNIIAGEDAVAIEQSFHDADVDQFDDFLLSEGIVSEEDLLQALSEYYQVPAFDAVGYFFEHHYVTMFPKEMLLRNSIIPLEVDQNSMVVIASRPDNAELLPEIGKYVSYDIQFYVGIGQDICDAVEEFYDKSDTEESFNEDNNEEMRLYGEFHLLEEEGDGNFSFVVDNEDKLE